MPQERLSLDGADSIEQFARDLRALKHEAGDPTLGSLSERTGISKSVLSEALSGRRAPTERTVRHLTAALGSSPDGWVQRHNRLTRTPGVTQKPPLSSPTETAPPPDTPEGRLPRSQLILVAAVSATVGALVASGIWAGAITLNGGGDRSSYGWSAQEQPLLDPGDGVDPMRTVCAEDAAIVASEPRFDDQVYVQMLFSSDCMAAWGRVTRYDGKSAGNSVQMRIYPASDIESERSQERKAYDVQSVYTPLLMESNADAQLCGVASVTSDGVEIELAPPVCIRASESQ